MSPGTSAIVGRRESHVAASPAGASPAGASPAGASPAGLARSRQRLAPRPRSLIAQIEHPEIRLEGREGVVGDLRRGRGQGSEQGGLAGIGQADESHVRDEPQLEANPAFLARLALLGVVWGLMRRRREVDVAQAATAAAADEERLLCGDQVAEQLAGFAVEDARPRRNLQGQVLAGLAVHALAGAATARSGLEVMGVAVIAQAGFARIDGQVDGTPSAAVAPVRAAARDVSLTPEGGRAVAAVAAANPDLHLIEKHEWIVS